MGSIVEFQTDKRKIALYIFIVVFINLLQNICFIPGPDFLHHFSDLAFYIITHFTLFTVLLSPIGLIAFTTLSIKNKKIKIEYILALLIPVYCYFNYFVVKEFLRDSARNYAIEEAQGLVAAIEEFNIEKGDYPITLRELIPDYIDAIPQSKIIGIREFRYSRVDSIYELEFGQNAISFFNRERVIYNPLGTQEGEGDMPQLYETGFENWKYYIFD